MFERKIYTYYKNVACLEYILICIVIRTHGIYKYVCNCTHNEIRIMYNTCVICVTHT